jgi:hypothetical protein
VKVGRGPGRKQRFSGILLGEWGHCTSNKVEVFGVSKSRTGKFVVHVMRSQDWVGRVRIHGLLQRVTQLGRQLEQSPDLDLDTRRSHAYHRRLPSGNARHAPAPALRRRGRRCRTAAHWSHVKQVLQAHHGQAEDRAYCGGHQ